MMREFRCPNLVRYFDGTAVAKRREAFIVRISFDDGVEGSYMDYYLYLYCICDSYRARVNCHLRIADYGIRGEWQPECIPKQANAAARVERQALSVPRCGARSRVLARARTATDCAWRPQGACGGG